MKEPTLSGLYAITPDALLREPARLLDAVTAAARGGARLIQYRDKHHFGAERLALARALLQTCRAAGARLIVNDDAELAQSIGADGVHLGAGDGSLADARARLGPRALIGASCGNSLERARQARAAGADYVAFGRFFASTTKPDAPPADLRTLTAARRELDLAICAIGGITADNATQVLAAGADLVAAVEGVFGAADVEAAARAYVSLWPGSDTRIP
ncbi:thiamine phosphate synthase [Solimonas terrae]|uniref:Thiamine-phosphate synthase n=1 Tax=Solimonas terrae TaxID=1396819 RepID=A0A6M2BRH3_9GAMM|nr:thiamine phosphate synthase [Solimonas terrae]NGY05088.1 thiamine phosphate synthase [Solimonas terrae]